MPVTEITDAYVLAPAKKPILGVSGNFDSALLLFTEATQITANGNSTAIAVEGGSGYEWVLRVGAVTGSATPTLTETLQVSMDGGSTYFPLGPVVALSDTTEAQQWIARNGFVPMPTTLTASNRFPLVRVNHVVSGTSPNFTMTEFLRPVEDGTDLGLEDLT